MSSLLLLFILLLNILTLLVVPRRYIASSLLLLFILLLNTNTSRRSAKRSETAALAAEISLQPWRAYGVDGVILFSDILTPLPALGVEFRIDDADGPVVEPPLRSRAQVDRLRACEPDASLGFVGEALARCRAAVGARAAVVGFVGGPLTLAAYAVEGRGARRPDFPALRAMARDDPGTLRALLARLADGLARYAAWQVARGAQIVMVFESCAGVLSADQYDEFALPYQRAIVDEVRRRHPTTPVVLYARGDVGVARMAASGAQVLAVDHTVDLAGARRAAGARRVLQGNVDPAVLLQGRDEIERAVAKCLADGGGPGRHILNLGHGVPADAPEENVRAFVEAAKRGGRARP